MAQARSPLAGLRLHRLVGKRQGVPGRGSGALVAAAAAANSGTASASVPADSVMLFNITDGSSVEEKVAQLLNHAEVAMVQPDYVRYLAVAPPPPPTAWVPSGVGRAMVPNDVFFGTYSSHWHLSQISAPVAWDTTTGSKQVGVCMVDTGARVTHQDLAGNIASAWNRAGSPANDTLLYHNVSDHHGHGTHTAGIVGAVGNNLVGVTGVAWNVSLRICKAASYNTYWGFFFATSDVLDCYTLCKQAGVRVVSASYGGYYVDALEEAAIADLQQAGILFVAAAGNDGWDNDALDADIQSNPASYGLDNILSVAASRADDQLASFSNYGATKVHLAAPGINVMSTWASADNSYLPESGTSMATPIVAGAAALLFAAKPDATYTEVRDALQNSVDLVPGLNGLVSSSGRLNVARALETLLFGAASDTPPATYVFKTQADIFFNFSFYDSRAEVFGVADAASCQDSCQVQSWCYYFMYRATPP
ncbi:hypothetical protein CHLNCDRAFT_135242 [Chlorella variabilis]|uniref:Peptidase S8/S53 domain-containing protein n=1 Tax=Chlorella variabilis TaxID=554065 RepID=E1ZHT3_CHLVA|nr:hypothetical protein CHLNCDRAFT_135242 [Chlorella variabilis]EFN54517.1 hypothetical protein CHLNCDRAFT_135242 [Chlorella variabilis]|eukprot:XP_005846619.1 hypothetical protein CHLNCDRAFT_135242 [Chlorella variabilis]